MHRLGIDLGGTKIEGIVLDAAGREQFRQRVPTEGDRGYTGILENIAALYHDLVSHMGDGASEHTLGIGAPGSMSPDDLLRTANPACANDKPFKRDLEQLLGHNVNVQNDANCFAVAEALSGAGSGYDLVFGAVLGTGCGGGLVQGGKLLTGFQGRTGEWGHMLLDPRGPVCSCGNRGCAQALISGTALEQRYKEMTGQQRSVQEIVGEYRQDEPQAGKLMSEFFVNFGKAMASLISVLDPDVIVLGGGLSNIDEIYQHGVQEIKRAIADHTDHPPVVRNKLGDSAGVIGAALIGR